MKTIKITAELKYDDRIMHGKSKEDIDNVISLLKETK